DPDAHADELRQGPARTQVPGAVPRLLDGPDPGDARCLDELSPGDRPAGQPRPAGHSRGRSKMMRFLTLVVLLAGLGAVGCNCCFDEARSKATEPEKLAATAASAECCCEAAGNCEAADDHKDWGTLKGRIVFAGDKLPETVELKVDKDQEHCLSKGK